MWLFLRCSGVDNVDGGELDGTSVDDEVSESRGGRLEGSKSRSGIGGDTKGLRVILRSTMRKTALETRYVTPLRTL